MAILFFLGYVLIFPFYFLLCKLAPITWVLPYVLGMMIHHFVSRNGLRATGWLFLYLLIHPIFASFLLKFPVLGPMSLIGELISGGLVSFTWLTISTVIMPLQTILWFILWYRYRRDDWLSGWRTVGITAFMVGLVFTIPLLFYFAEELNVRAETRAHTVIRKQAEKQALDQIWMETTDIKKKTGFKEYPNANFYLYDRAYEVYQPMGRYMIYTFRTKDTSEKVIDFYTGCAKAAGFKVQRSTYDLYYQYVLFPQDRHGSVPAMVAIGEGNTAMVVSPAPMHDKEEWEVTLWWNTNSNFDRGIKEHFKLGKS